MRTRLIVTAAVGAALAVSACATSATLPGYSDEMARLSSDCDARDGILVATGASSGVAARDYACQLPVGTGRTS